MNKISSTTFPEMRPLDNLGILTSGINVAMHREGRLRVTARAVQVKSNLQINWLCSFLITGMCLLSPNLQSILVIKKIWDSSKHTSVSPCGQKGALEWNWNLSISGEFRPAIFSIFSAAFVQTFWYLDFGKFFQCWIKLVCYKMADVFSTFMLNS